jgi:hypothetical protein
MEVRVVLPFLFCGGEVVVCRTMCGGMLTLPAAPQHDRVNKEAVLTH